MIQEFKHRLVIIKELFLYLWKNKLWWLIPLVVVLLIATMLLFLGQATPIGPFIYTLF